MWPRSSGAYVERQQPLQPLHGNASTARRSQQSQSKTPKFYRLPLRSQIQVPAFLFNLDPVFKIRIFFFCKSDLKIFLFWHCKMLERLFWFIDVFFHIVGSFNRWQSFWVDYDVCKLMRCGFWVAGHLELWYLERIWWEDFTCSGFMRFWLVGHFEFWKSD